jgi:cyclopropane-fatty-acyl-phospholipid synthase
MEISNRCLKADGIACLQTIGRNISTTTFSRWGEKYIFPNSMLPSIAQIGAAMEGLFVMEDWHNFGPDYDRTLMAWYAKIENVWGTLNGSYDERFRRMWRFYLLGFAGPFRAREVQLWQIVMAKRGRTQPECRIIQTDATRHLNQGPPQNIGMGRPVQ